MSTPTPAGADSAPGHPEVTRIVAPNPGPMTLEGTNTYIVGRDPAWVIDPGPAIASHIDAVAAEAERRGGIGAALITHSHLDHNEGAAMLGAELIWGSTQSTDEGAALAAASNEAGIRKVRGSHPAPDSEAGPFEVIPAPGHANDHAVFVLGEVCFCGDLILGQGSSIVPPRAAGGSVADYLRSLDRVEGLGLELLCPGHGPWITDPAARVAEYRAHRLDRERKLLVALDAGERSREKLLDAAWADVPERLRGAAALALQAHLEKLAGEGLRIGELSA